MTADTHHIEQIIEGLKRAKSRDDRYPILKEYKQLIDSGLSLEAGLRAVEAATEFPPPQDPTMDSARSLVGYLADSHFPRDHGVAAIPSILDLYLSLRNGARMYAIWLLMNIPEREGALAVMDLVRQHFHNGDIPEGAFNSRYNHPLHADVYFPELLDYARLSDPSHAFKIWSICLKYCEDGVLKPERIATRSSMIAAEYTALKAKLLAAQAKDNWHKDYEYLADRETAGLLLDLLRFFPTDEIKRQLSSAFEEYTDPVLLCWACISALWLDLPVDSDIIETVAANDEARKWFYKKLKEHDRTAVFPEQYRTKAAFAQADFVNWLTFPTELGHVPDAVELTHIIVEETDQGAVEWFLFRYRDAEMASSDWMAGWSGPFLKDAEPGDILTPGGTFSHFDRWDSKAPEGHLRLGDEAGDLSPKITVIACD